MQERASRLGFKRMMIAERVGGELCFGLFKGCFCGCLEALAPKKTQVLGWEYVY